MGYSGEGEMQKLTEATGGRVINVGNKFDKLKEAFDQIAAELRSQYNLGYTSTNPKLDGTYRKLEIKSKQGYKIQTRAGYYATAREPAAIGAASCGSGSPRAAGWCTLRWSPADPSLYRSNGKTFSLFTLDEPEVRHAFKISRLFPAVHFYNSQPPLRRSSSHRAHAGGRGAPKPASKDAVMIDSNENPLGPEPIGARRHFRHHSHGWTLSRQSH